MEIGVAVLSLAVYLATLAPSLPGGDSSELIVVAATGGVAHPPGYPLYGLLGRAWIALVPVGSVAWRMNLFSAVCAALAVAVLAGVVRRLTGSASAGFAGAALLALAPPFWKNAIVAEVFALNALLAALLLDAFVRAHARKSARDTTSWPLLAMAFLCGLLWTHHHSLVLLALPLALVTAAMLLPPAPAVQRWLPGFQRPWTPTPRLLATTLAAFGLGLVPLVWLPIAASGDPVRSWGDLHGWRDFLRLLVRADYGTFRLDPAGAGHTGASRPVWALLYLESLPRTFGGLGLALVAAGTLALRRHRALSVALAGFALLQALFFLRIGFPADSPLMRGVVERFSVLPDLVLALAGGLGAAWLLARVPQRARAVAGGALLLVIALASIALHGQRLSQRGNFFVEHLGRDVLASVPPAGVLFVRGDVVSNAVVALQTLERVRPDVTVVDQELLSYDWYLRALRRRTPDLLPRLGAGDCYDGQAGSLNVSWIAHLEGRRPVAFFGFKEDSWALRYEMIPSGHVAVAHARGMGPSSRDRATEALDQLASFHLDDVFAAQDPGSFEADERPRHAELVDRAAALLARRETVTIGAGHPGLARLASILERAERDPAPEPALLHAAGILRVLHPRFRDLARAKSDLERWLATGASGPAADQARQWIARLERPEPLPVH